MCHPMAHITGLSRKAWLSCWPQQQLPEQHRHQTSSAAKSRKMAAGSPWFTNVRHLPWSMIHYDSFFPPPNLSGFRTATTSALGKESVKVLIRPKDLYPGGHQTCQEPGMSWSKAPAATPASTARFLWKYTSKSSTIFRLIIILQFKWLLHVVSPYFWRRQSPLEIIPKSFRSCSSFWCLSANILRKNMQEMCGKNQRTTHYRMIHVN